MHRGPNRFRQCRNGFPTMTTTLPWSSEPPSPPWQWVASPSATDRRCKSWRRRGRRSASAARSRRPPRGPGSAAWRRRSARRGRARGMRRRSRKRTSTMRRRRLRPRRNTAANPEGKQKRKAAEAGSPSRVAHEMRRNSDWTPLGPIDRHCR